VDEAERKQFNVRRVEIAGSTYTRDRAFRKRMVVGMTEGDIFTRAALERSVRNIGKMKEVYPITLQDVEVRLNREDKVIDVVICVIQKPRLL
jgi:outer membrane protein assembly factor BamA